MKLPQFRIRTLVFVIWLAALLFAGVVDVLKELENRNRVEVVNERIDANGSASAEIIFFRRTYYYLGPIPIGPLPLALFSGVAFAASVAGWALWQRFKRRK